MYLRLLVLLVALLAACHHAALPKPAPTDRERIASMLDRTVSITVKCGENEGYGSGVHVGPGLIATAAHVAIHFYEGQACTLNRNGLPLTVVALDEEADVALVTSGSVAFAPVQWADEYLGMEVVVTGWARQILTGKKGLQVSRGNLAAKVSKKYWRVTAPFWSGNSGGPVWDEQGRLLGLAVAGWTSWDLPVVGEFYIVPGPVLRKFIDANSGSTRSASR